MKNNFNSYLIGVKFQKSIERYFGFILILLFSFIPLVDLFHPGLPITHDGQDHLARIANFYDSLQEGNIIPRWAGNLNWGYGHPILMFLYPLPSYLSSLFHFFGFSITDSLKIVFGVGFIASGIAMYLWVRNFLDEASGIIAGVLYVVAPYRFVDLYVRGAIGEHTAFIFPPLILYFLLKTSKIKSFDSKKNYLYFLGAVFSLAGLLLSHNAISLMFLPFVVFYVMYLVWTNKQKVILIYQYTSMLVIGFGLSAFFIIPAFFEGKYTLRDIVTKGEYLNRFVTFSDLFKISWSYGGSGQLSVQIGLIHLVGIALSILLSYKLFHKNKKLFILYITSLIYFLISLVLMLEQSSIVWQKITVLQKFQFPWRLLSVAVFMSAFFSGLTFYLINNKFIKNFLLILFLFLAILFNKDYWHANSYLYLSDNFFKGIYNGTTDTGESAPKWSIRFMEKRPTAKIQVVEGAGRIKEIFRNSTIHKYIIESSDKTRIRENTLYFPGWVVLVDGEPVNIEFQDPRHRGLVTFYVNEGKHFVDIIFTETKLRKISSTLSLVSFGIIFIYGILIFSVKKIKNEK